MQRFNSSMVRLKAPNTLMEQKMQFSFQFQYGAIKGPKDRLQLLQMPLFQFQYGAIKGKESVSLIKIYVMRFNSSMVRLKDSVSP